MAKILFFGVLSDASEPLNVKLPVSVKTVEGLKLWLGKTNPLLHDAFERTGNRVAINKVMAQYDSAVCDADEIAFMSPLSGG